MPFWVISVAASLALRSASSSRMRLESSVDLPVMNCGSPPGCVVESSMRVRGVSTKRTSGERPPTCGEFVLPAPPRGFGDIPGDEFWVAEAETVGARDVLSHGIRGESFCCGIRHGAEDIFLVIVPIEPPHTDTIRCFARNHGSIAGCGLVWTTPRVSL